MATPSGPDGTSGELSDGLFGNLPNPNVSVPKPAPNAAPPGSRRARRLSDSAPEDTAERTVAPEPTVAPAAPSVPAHPPTLTPAEALAASATPAEAPATPAPAPHESAQAERPAETAAAASARPVAHDRPEPSRRTDSTGPISARSTFEPVTGYDSADAAQKAAAAAVTRSAGLAAAAPDKPAATPSAAPGGSLEDLFGKEPPTSSVAAARPAKKRRKGCLTAAIIVLVVLGLIVGGGAFAWNTYGDKISDALGWGPPADWEEGIANGEVTVTVAAGDTGEPVSTTLFDAGVTRTETVFYDYLIDNNLNPTFFPGVYTLQKQMTAAAALAALEDPANRIENSAAVAEGSTIAAILPGIAESMQIPLADLEAAVADPAVYGVDAQSLEGWLFPAVYTFDPGVTAQQIIQAMVDRTRESLAAAGVPAGDEQRVLTTASIIQREGRVADFDKVSRVIQNRLDDGMLLQMDSTAQYGYGELHEGSVSTSAEAQFDDNPWNTYVHAGLPVTPIATASDAAIDAAMNPADGPWFYFVTVNPDSGETVFSVTYDEHLAAIDQWAAWCAANGNPESGCSG